MAQSCPWPATCPDAAPPTDQNHNVYLGCENSDVTVVGNITADASSTGWKQRSGGFAENNLSLRNPIGLEWGNNASSCDEAQYFASGVATHNVFIESRDIGSSHHAFGIWMQRIGGEDKDSIIKMNLIMKNTLGSGGGALHLNEQVDDVLVQGNVVFDWKNAPALNVACRDGLFPTSMEIKDNEFQFHATGGGALVRQRISFDEPGVIYSYEGNKYYSTADSDCWFRAEPTNPCDSPPCQSYQDWLNESAESRASNQQVS